MNYILHIIYNYKVTATANCTGTTKGLWWNLCNFELIIIASMKASLKKPNLKLPQKIPLYES